MHKVHELEADDPFVLCAARTQAKKRRTDLVNKAKSWPKADHNTSIRTVVVAVIRFKDEEDYYPFERGERLLFMGEVENMSGHCVIVNSSGKTFWGYHSDNFHVVPKEEM